METFGSDVVDTISGEVNRKKLGAIVFSDPVSFDALALEIGDERINAKRMRYITKQIITYKFRRRT